VHDGSTAGGFPVEGLQGKPAGGGLSGTYPNPTLASITPTGATVARTIQNRFADSINVLDYGADPTGANDSWIAIQRAIYDSGSAPQNRIASTISATETSTMGNRTILRLYNYFQAGAGKYSVYLPAGTYKISKPIVVWQGVHISGHIGGNSTVIIQDTATHGQFTAITDYGWTASTDESANEPFTIFGFPGIGYNYAHGCIIENLQIKPNYAANQSGLIEKEYHWVKWPYTTASYATVSGTSGSNELTSTYAFNYWREGKIKLYPSGLVLDITHAIDNKIYLKENLSSNVSSAQYAFGVAKHNGIWMSGGEGSRISNVWCNFMLGSGIHINFGSPNQIIENTMMNYCDVAYLIENSPAVLIKPSGDCNNVILQCKGFNNTTLIAGKFEDVRPPTGPSNRSDVFVPYVNLTFARSLIEIEALPSGTPTFVSINGLTHNAASNDGSIDKSCVDIYEYSYPAIVKIDGLRTLDWGKYFARKLNFNGTVREIFARDNSFINDDERTFYSGTSPYLSTQRTNYGSSPSNLTFAALRDPSNVHLNNRSGITLDIQNKQTLNYSGRMPNRAKFVRSGTSATITYRNSENTADALHGLQVGDYVKLTNYSFTIGSGSLSPNTNPRDGIGGTFAIKSVSLDGYSFTINVANSGAEEGTAQITALQYAEFHNCAYGEHRFQMTDNRGSIYTYDFTDPNNPIPEYRAFSIYDRKKDVLASLAVPSSNTGNWWVKQQFSSGGTIANPAIRILHGTGAPSATAPNGSIYLRTDGDASSTMYVRAGDQWRPLGAYEP
jgi:hypothetical protein